MRPFLSSKLFFSIEKGRRDGQSYHIHQFDTTQIPLLTARIRFALAHGGAEEIRCRMCSYTESWRFQRSRPCYQSRKMHLGILLFYWKVRAGTEETRRYWIFFLMYLASVSSSRFMFPFPPTVYCGVGETCT